ncbi:transferrin-binding protein-like solute binding protein [Hoeflea sp.]|uniref:transferrin-binding protein-like solute binding protein n=1 Tax=Hoeflea sp. TaxID=1940281 RepID=UPI003B020839
MMKQSPQETAGGRTRTHGNARRALLCTAALLSLGLAACNTTGGTTTTTTTRTPAAPTTELGKARAAAKAAMDAAKTQSDAAAVEAAKAEAAQMNIAMLQTGDPMAKKHAEAARAAARAAMTAYNTAKAESAKAAAATTSTAAVEARIAAQAAQRTAQAQAKIAMDKAAEAVKAAGMEVKVTYDDDGQATYRVGEVTIVPGSEMMEKTVDGKTLVTGTTEWSLNKNSRREPVTKDNGDGMAQPTVVARDVFVGSRVDSEDDTVRMQIFDRYVTGKTNRMVAIYRTDPGAGDEQYDTEDDAPYGVVSESGKKYVIKRAEGEFYAVSGGSAPTKENANELTIESSTKGKKNLIYYYEKDGEKKWLEYKSEERLADDTRRITYKATSVLENVRFPTGKSYEHMNYGTWAKLKEDGNTIADLGIAFVNKLPDGVVTPTGDMPNFGEAKYQGHWTGNVRTEAADGNGAINGWTSGATTTANFGKNTISAKLDNLATLEGTIDGNGFSGTKADMGVLNSALKLDSSGKFEGKFSGNFFGPKAEELGGVFDFTSEGARAGEFRGAFGGGRITD